MNEIFEELREALFYMRVGELRETCKQLNLPYSGIKGVLIERIVHFLRTGKVVKGEVIPAVSRAKKGVQYPLHPDTLILYGNYKNDLATRIFMKSLVGDHFHFTAQGIDWIKERWREGAPSTYREFATFWQEQKKSPPKDEWAYIRFTQGYLAESPGASREDLLAAWKEEQRRQTCKAREIIGRLRALN